QRAAFSARARELLERTTRATTVTVRTADRARRTTASQRWAGGDSTAIAVGATSVVAMAAVRVTPKRRSTTRCGSVSVRIVGCSTAAPIATNATMNSAL